MVWLCIGKLEIYKFTQSIRKIFKSLTEIRRYINKGYYNWFNKQILCWRMERLNQNHSRWKFAKNRIEI